MARGGKAKGRAAGPGPAPAEPVREAVREALREPRTGFEPLVTAHGGGTLDFSAMLAIADILPVMVGYLDREFRYRFVNKPLADWIDMPRSKILGMPIGEMVGADGFEMRRPLLEQALTGERTFFASTLGTRPAARSRSRPITCRGPTLRAMCAGSWCCFRT